MNLRERKREEKTERKRQRQRERERERGRERQTTMASKKTAWHALSKGVQEMRIHLCQTSAESDGVRYAPRVT